MPSRLRTMTRRTTLLPDGPATSIRTRAGRWVARTTKAATPSTAASGRTSDLPGGRRAAVLGRLGGRPGRLVRGSARGSRGGLLAVRAEVGDGQRGRQDEGRPHRQPAGGRPPGRSGRPCGGQGDRWGRRSEGSGAARGGHGHGMSGPRRRCWKGARDSDRDDSGDGDGGRRGDRGSDRRGLDERHERGRRHDPELGADDLAVALELAHGAGPVVTSEERSDEQRARRLPQRLEAGHGAGGVLREPGVASLERPTGEALERTHPLALEVVALLLDPRVVPAGEQLVPRQRDEQRPLGRRVGHGRPEGVDVHDHVGREPDAGPVGGEQPVAPLVGLCHRPSEAGQRTRVGAVRPQRAGDLRAGPRAAEREQGAQALLAATERDDVAVHDELPLAEEVQATASGESGGATGLPHGRSPRHPSPQHRASPVSRGHPVRAA